MSRKTRGALSSSTGRARADPIGGSQFAADRRPGVSHLMVACLPVGRDVQISGGRGEAVVAVAMSGSAAGRPSEEVKVKVSLPAGAEGVGMIRRGARGGQDFGYIGGRDFCVAVSGGLASVMELVHPLRHVGWAGRGTVTEAAPTTAPHGSEKKREILRMSRVPSTWRRAVGIEGCKAVGNDHYAEPLVGDVDGAAGEFMVMCEDGWLGWYQSHHRRFEVSWLDSAPRAYTVHGDRNVCLVSHEARLLEPFCVNWADWLG